MTPTLTLLQPTQKKLRDGALACARRGFRVVPVQRARANGACSCGRAECSTPGKHPVFADWGGRATTNEALIRLWYEQLYRGANIGIATGSTLIVLDVDPRHGGDDSLDHLEFRHGRLPDTVTVYTGGHGQHYYFAHPGGVVPNYVSLLPGLDIRGDGGLVIAPPSVHATGDSYVWDGMIGIDAPLASAPEWLLALIAGSTARGRSAAAGAVASGYGVAILEGARNTTLASMAGYLRRLGASPDMLYDALAAVNAAQCQPPLPDRELRSIAQSCAKYKPAMNVLGAMDCDFSELPLVIATMPAATGAALEALKTNSPEFLNVWIRRKEMKSDTWAAYALSLAGRCVRAGLSTADTAAILAQHKREHGDDALPVTVAEIIRLIAKAHEPRRDAPGQNTRKRSAKR